MHICFLAASASIRSHPSVCSCMQGWRWAFPGLIRASRMFSVQGRWESAAHKYVRAVLSDGQFTGGDRWWSQHTLPTNMLSGCWFCLIGSFAAQIPTYLMLMMKSQESWRDSCKLSVCVSAVFIHTPVGTVARQFDLHCFSWGGVNTHTPTHNSMHFDLSEDLVGIMCYQSLALILTIPTNPLTLNQTLA